MASDSGQRGFWVRGYGEKPSFGVYPFGDLILVTVAPTGPSRQSGEWQERVAPAMLVGYGSRHGMCWGIT